MATWGINIWPLLATHAVVGYSVYCYSNSTRIILFIIYVIYYTALPNEKHYILLGVGIGAAMLALFVIVFIVVAIVVLLKIIYTSKKRSQYVRVDSTSGDAIN